MAKKKYYVVWAGRNTGIFTDWATTEKSVLKFPNAKYKSFSTKQEAELAFAEKENLAKKNITKNKDQNKILEKKSKKHFDVQIYCDGGCEPNPGKAASGIAVYRNGVISELWYGLFNERGTNNTAELNALHESLFIAKKEIMEGKSVEVLCDSMYSINCIAKWAMGWKKNGWQKKGGTIKNLEIIQRAHTLYMSMSSNFQLSHIKAHVGIEGNELADRMTMYGILKKNRTLCLYDQKIDVKKILAMKKG